MKALHFIILLFLPFLTICCGGSGSRYNRDIDSSLALKITGNDTFQKGQIINQVICRSDPSKSYALYIPDGSNNIALPVVYFFDPHADGLLPVNKYKALADSFHFILAGSNNSKNGNDFNDAKNIFEVINEDLQKRMAVNTHRIYLCGFSGGAKVATYLGLHFHEIKGVIASGAGLEEITKALDFKFSFTAITGNGDMNMTDLVSIDKILDNTSTRHRIIFFDGIHEWPSESTMSIAFEGFQFDAMRNNLISKDSVLINRFVIANQKMIIKYEKENDFLKVVEICKLSTEMLDNITNQADWFHKKEDSISHTTSYQKQEEERQNLLQKEENTKTAFQQHFQNEDKKYWTQTITEIKSRSKGKSSNAAMNKRLEAYLSLAFYSLSNRLINQNQNREAEYFVSLYKLADATNSEAWYLSAILNARNNDGIKAKEDLIIAVALGFNDKERLEQQPEFSNGRVTIHWNDIKK